MRQARSAPRVPPSQPSCVPAPTGAVKDSHEGELQKAAAFFCSQHADGTVQNGPINIADTIIAGDETEGLVTLDVAFPPSMGKQDDVYDITVTSVPNCTPDGEYILATPVANNQCADILHSAWKQCRHFLLALFLRVANGIQVPIKEVVERSLLAAWSIVLLRNTRPRMEGRNLALGCLPAVDCLTVGCTTRRV